MKRCAAPWKAPRGRSQRGGAHLGRLERLHRHRQPARRPAAFGPDHSRRPPRHGQDRARHQHGVQRRARSGRRTSRRRSPEARRAVPSSASKWRPTSWRRAFSPSRPKSRRKMRTGKISSEDFRTAPPGSELATLPLYHRRHRRPVDRADRGPRPAAEARRSDIGLIVVDYLQLLSGRPASATTTASRKSPRSPRPQDAGQGTERAGDRAVAALARRRATATTSGRCCPTCANRARSSRTPTWCMFVFREDYYLKSREPKAGTAE